MDKAGRFDAGQQKGWMAPGSPPVTMMIPTSGLGVPRQLLSAKTLMRKNHLNSQPSPLLLLTRYQLLRSSSNNNSNRYRNHKPTKPTLPTDRPFSHLHPGFRSLSHKSKMLICSHRKTLPMELPSVYPSYLATPARKTATTITHDPTREQHPQESPPWG